MSYQSNPLLSPKSTTITKSKGKGDICASSPFLVYLLIKGKCKEAYYIVVKGKERKRRDHFYTHFNVLMWSILVLSTTIECGFLGPSLS
jgi:hypothetical protein